MLTYQCGAWIAITDVSASGIEACGPCAGVRASVSAGASVAACGLARGVACGLASWCPRAAGACIVSSRAFDRSNLVLRAGPALSSIGPALGRCRIIITCAPVSVNEPPRPTLVRASVSNLHPLRSCSYVTHTRYSLRAATLHVTRARRNVTTSHCNRRNVLVPKKVPTLHGVVLVPWY